MLVDPILYLIDKGLGLQGHKFSAIKLFFQMILIFILYKIHSIRQMIKTAPNLISYNFKVSSLFQKMADLFTIIRETQPQKSQYIQKRQIFRNQIRRKQLQQTIRQQRILANNCHDIKLMIDKLPLSWDETVTYIIDYPQYHQAITKLIIDKVYHAQLSEQSRKNEDKIRFLLPQNLPKNLHDVKKLFYFFSLLIKYQGHYSPSIFKRYLLILIDLAKNFKAINLIFTLFNEVIKKQSLDWAPIEEIVYTIRFMQNLEKQEQNSIQNQELQTYVYLVSHYYPLVQRTEKIKNRIKQILQKGAEFFDQVKQKLFFKLCLNLTSNENSGSQNYWDYKNQNEKQGKGFFHQAMIKGSIVNKIYRQIFFSSNEKLKCLCLRILQNLMIQYDGTILWSQQKVNRIKDFNNEIRDQSHSSNLFKTFCEVFLISILELPCNQLFRVFKNQINVMELILYILEKVDPIQQEGKLIHEYAKNCVTHMLKHGDKEIHQIVTEILLDTRWNIFFRYDQQFIFECKKIVTPMQQTQKVDQNLSLTKNYDLF